MKADFCKHYDAHAALLGDKVCRAGINMRILAGGERLGWVLRTPCMKKNSSLVKCESFSDHTQEEIDDHDGWVSDAIERIKKSQPLIQQLKEDHPDGGSGVADCPCCSGKLHWGIAACNGHSHGRCETEDCLSWME